ncbi:MAG TPA: hypothetical protein VFS54_09355 [Solirubrobacterales bacterium]|nr:hypothetical protein [Solirubrobacterales bacterium]
MKNGWISWLCLAVLAIGVAPASAAAAGKNVSLEESDIPGQAVEFELEGSNGYLVTFGARGEPYIEGNDRESRLGVGVFREDESGFAAYGVPAIVSESYVKADLGPYGKVDLVRRPSGRMRTIPIRCSGGDTFTYEPADYEGIVEFRGEQGYTEVEATRVRALPLLTSFCGGGSGRGESRGSDERGARLKGVSYAHGRALSFQLNKNHKRGRVLFEAEMRERRGRVSIYRAAEGWLPPPSFRFDPDLKTATLSPPAPFSGSADLSRARNSVSPLWSGDLTIGFPGRQVPLTGRGMHVSLVHACFQLFDGPEARSC